VEPAVVVARKGRTARRVYGSLRSLRPALLRQPGSVRRRAISRRSQLIVSRSHARGLNFAMTSFLAS
jgi:hypothetical protein